MLLRASMAWFVVHDVICIWAFSSFEAYLPEMPEPALLLSQAVQLDNG